MELLDSLAHWCRNLLPSCCPLLLGESKLWWFWRRWLHIRWLTWCLLCILVVGPWPCCHMPSARRGNKTSSLHQRTVNCRPWPKLFCWKCLQLELAINQALLCDALRHQIVQLLGPFCCLKCSITTRVGTLQSFMLRTTLATKISKHRKRSIHRSDDGLGLVVRQAAVEILVANLTTVDLDEMQGAIVDESLHVLHLWLKIGKRISRMFKQHMSASLEPVNHCLVDEAQHRPRLLTSCQHGLFCRTASGKVEDTPSAPWSARSRKTSAIWILEEHVVVEVSCSTA